MRSPVTFPTQVPVAVSTHKASRRPVLLFGQRGRPDKSGWTLEERAIQLPQLGVTRPSLYIGPHIELTLDADPETRGSAFAQLLTWVTLAPTNGIVGIVVPRWTDYDLATREMIQLISRTGFHGLKSPHGILEAPPEAALRILYPSSLTKPALVDVPARGRIFNAATQLAELQADMTDDILYDVFKRAVGHEVTRRDVASAATTAAALRAQGHSNRHIRTYLETFGYENSKGVIGRWHDARLAEILVRNSK